MTGRQTLIAILLLIAVAVAYWKGIPERHDTSSVLPGPASLPLPANTPLVELSADEVTGMTMRLGPDTRNTRRTPKGWTGVERPELLDGMLADLTKIGMISELAVQPAELPEFGLQPARSELVLMHGTRILSTLEIGDRNPSNTGVYVRLPESNRVLLAGALLVWQFENAFHAIGPSVSPTPDS